MAKNAYFDTIKGIKLNSVLPVKQELLNLAASIYIVLIQEKLYLQTIFYG